MGWVTGIKFDGLNHKEVEEFIKETKKYVDTDLHLELGEGEIYHEGRYYKAVCWIFVNHKDSTVKIQPDRDLLGLLF